MSHHTTPLFQFKNPSELTQSPLYAGFLKDALKGFDQLTEERQKGLYPLFDQLYETQDVEDLQKQADIWIQRYTTLVVLGTGGSSLGGQTVCALHQSALAQDSPCRVLFMDNLDPHTFEQLEKNLDFQKTVFLAVSKSGSTPETLCQVLRILPHYPKNDQIKEHLFVLTEPKDSPLRQLANQYGLTCFTHHPGIGGRFSVLSNVGLLPAATAKVSVQDVREGAQHILEHPQQALEGAALAATACHTGYTQTVLMPYIDRLAYFTFWFRQLWAESLGKEGKGTTPLNALGTVDQHSQLQLYLDGPRDKFFTLISLSDSSEKKTLSIPESITGLSYLQNKTMADLVSAEYQATIKTLENKGCPVRVLSLDSLNAKTMGGLLMHYMLETILTAHLLKVNAFDQPAVEESKILTRHYLQNPEDL